MAYRATTQREASAHRRASVYAVDGEAVYLEGR
jgi:hypothetical protein